MVLDNIGKSINIALKKLLKKSIIDEPAIKELIIDVQRSLLVSDVNVELVMDITKKLEGDLIENAIPSGVSKRDYIIKIIWNILAFYLGEQTRKLEIVLGKPNLIMLVGIQGSGKTTTIAKLARYYQKKGIKTGVICADNFRPGAYDQLEQLVNKFSIPFYGDIEETNAIKLSNDGYTKMIDLGVELILLDTSGRHSEEQALIEEMQSITKSVKPKEIILIIDGTLGQQAGKQASAFKNATDIGSIIVTKLDGSGKGGGSLSAVAATKSPIKFIGVGEGIDDIEIFEPKEFVGRLLGIPDIKGLLKKVKEAEITLDKDKQTQFMKGNFSLIDMLDQIKSVGKLGSLSQIASMVGFKYKITDKEIDIQKDKIETWEVIMNSMTQKELKNPKILKISRKKRIALGSGVKPEAVNELLNQYNQMRAMAKKMGKHRNIKF